MQNYYNPDTNESVQHSTRSFSSVLFVTFSGLRSVFLLQFENQILHCSVCCLHLRARADAVSVGSTHEALVLKVPLFHVISEIWLLLQCAVALLHAETDALEQQTMHLHTCD